VDVVNAGNGCSAAFRPDGPASSFDGPYFLYVGNLKAHKNVNTVLRALALVDGFSMVLVCSDVQGVRDLAAANGVSDRVTRVSGIDDSALAELYRGAAATLVPSFIEGFGLPALESLCSGTQVVYWEGCRSVAEICGSHGIAVSNARNVYEWAEAMITAARLPAARYNSGAYSWPAVASRVNGILEAQSR
jgi:glycosyltransferase involved in cell wall biosynthesis